MKLTLINPNIVTQKGDLFSSGIPYMPLTLAYLAAYLRSLAHSIEIIDSFGEKPTQLITHGNYYIQGLTTTEIIEKIPQDTDAIFVYASLVVTHNTNLRIIKSIREHFKGTIIIIENTQSVIAYSLKRVAQDFLDAGANYIITGEPEYRAQKLLEAIAQKKEPTEIDGLIYSQNNIKIHLPKKEYIKEPDVLPFPAWDLFPLQNYWKLKYSHAPFTTNKYIPLLTSRGCTLPCKFCIVPETNERKWRARSAKNVFEEIKYWHNKYDICEFHIEDLNPTIRKDRMEELSKLIIESKLKIIWKFAAGTKIETIDKNTLNIMAKAGCVYVSMSPESGSLKVLKEMNKPFNHEFGIEMTKYMNSLGITTQACFVLGFPTETDEDLKMTGKYISKLTKAGIDEVAMFIMTPIPGSETEGTIKGYTELQQLTFSPTWRPDYKKLNKFRWQTYKKYLLLKLIYHPIKLLKQPFNIITRKFKTKMEMTVFRALKLIYLSRFNKTK